MKNRIVVGTLALILTTSICWAQPPRGNSGSVKKIKGVPERIAWYSVLEDGLAEAKRSGKPIMFLTAAPQCASIPGMW